MPVLSFLVDRGQKRLPPPWMFSTAQFCSYHVTVYYQTATFLIEVPKFTIQRGSVQCRDDCLPPAKKVKAAEKVTRKVAEKATKKKHSKKVAKEATKTKAARKVAEKATKKKHSKKVAEKATKMKAKKVAEKATKSKAAK